VDGGRHDLYNRGVRLGLRKTVPAGHSSAFLVLSNLILYPYPNKAIIDYCLIFRLDAS